MADPLQKAKLAQVLGAVKSRPGEGLVNTPMTDAEYKREILDKMNDKVEEEEEEIVVVNLNQLQSLVRKALLKLLIRPGWIKGYITHVKKEINIDDNPDSDPIIKEEVEQTMSEMVSAFAKKFKINIYKK